MKQAEERISELEDWLSKTNTGIDNKITNAKNSSKNSRNSYLSNSPIPNSIFINSLTSFPKRIPKQQNFI